MLAGPAALQLPVESTLPAAQLHARLVHVAGDGTAHLLNHGAARIGTDPSVRVDLGHLAIRLETGHRLRLEISASDFPRYPRPAGRGHSLTTRHLLSHRLQCTLDVRALLRVSQVA